MIIIDSETRYEGRNYKAIGAHGQNEEEFLYFAQPVDMQLKSHKNHDKILNKLLDGDEDLLSRKTTLEPDTETPEYAD